MFGLFITSVFQGCSQGHFVLYGMIGWWWKTNCKWWWRNWSWPNVRYGYIFCLEWLRKGTKKSGWLVCRPNFEPGNS